MIWATLKPKALQWRYLPVGLTVGIGIVLSTLSAALVWEWERLNKQTQFQRQADNLVYALQHNLEHYIFVTRFLEGLYEASQRVEPQEFQIFAEDILPNHPGIAELGWARRVTAPKREAYEQGIASQDGFSGFRIWEYSLTGQKIGPQKRSEYFPTIYVHPKNLKSMLGFDIYSEKQYRVAIEKSRKTGLMVMARQGGSEPNGRNNFLILQPIYDKTKVDSQVKNPGDLFFQGIVYLVFNPKNTVETAIEGLKLDRLNFHIYNSSQEELQSSLKNQSANLNNNFVLSYYDNDQQIKEESPHQEANKNSSPKKLPNCPFDSEWSVCLRSIQIADRQWSILVLPTPESVNSIPDSISTFVIGLLTTSTLAIYLWKSIAGAVQTERLVMNLRQVIQEMQIPESELKKQN